MQFARRWHQFTFRTLWLALTVLCVGLGLDAHQGKWIRDRRAARDLAGVEFYSAAGHPLLGRNNAPGGLWLFGERGCTIVRVAVEPFPDERVQQLRRLFPEARFDVLRQGRYEHLPVFQGE